MPRSKAATAAAPRRANGRARVVDQLGGVIDRNAKTNGPKTQRRLGKVNADLRSPIPHANSANAPAIYDGQDKVGTIVERGGSHFSYGNDDVLIGEYRTRLEAVRALPQGRA
jgi:hypothetical protein